MTMRKLLMEYQPSDSRLWLIMGEWFEDDIDTKDALYRQVDNMPGLLRVMEAETRSVTFQRPTQASPKKASDDCHTYDQENKMILETSNPEFQNLLLQNVPEYGKAKVKLVHQDGDVTHNRLSWSNEKRVMVMANGRKRYGYYPNWKEYVSVIFPEKKATENDKWMRSWTNVLNRLEKSGLWEDVAKDVRIALDVGYEKMKQAYTQYWERHDYSNLTEEDKLNAEKIKGLDERLVGYREDGTIYANTSIIWYMSKIAKVKKMHFGRKWLNDNKLAQIEANLKDKNKVTIWSDGRITDGYDVTFNYQPEDNKAWYSEEYRGCGNGHYYLALDATHALFYEDDQEHKMTIEELLDALDGCGIVYEDDELVRKTLLEWGWKNGLETILVRVKNEEK